jgi:hypothetical protein
MTDYVAMTEARGEAIDDRAPEGGNVGYPPYRRSLGLGSWSVAVHGVIVAVSCLDAPHFCETAG